MPSIRVRSPYVTIREPLNDQQGTSETSSQGPSNQGSPRFQERPTSLPAPSSSDPSHDISLTSPMSLRVPEETWRRRRSNSRVESHVMSTSSGHHRSFPWSTEAQPSSSTDALNPAASPNISAAGSPSGTMRRPGLLTVEGSPTDITVPMEGTPGRLERAFIHEFKPPGSPSSQSTDSSTTTEDSEDLHHDDIVEHLDVIDPQVGTVSNLTNAANSILIPPLGFSRRPVIVLAAPNRPRPDSEKDQYQDALDRHVDDVLQRPSKFRRTMMGIWSFLKTPMGILTGIYGFLVVFWGAAIVFFLAKFINFHNANTQGFWVEVSSQIVCGLFTVTSVGFIPSRILSTYRVLKIWKYKRLTVSRRKSAGLPQLFDVDDLPDPAFDPNFVRVLSDKEHRDLHRQQVKFAYHQTWYRPHGTETHRAFPISMALWICVANDLNSIFQVILCGTMWGLNRFQRPAWTTGILIPGGFLAGIAAGVLIWRGGERTKRVEAVRARLLAALSSETPRTSSIIGSISRRTPAPLPPADEREEFQAEVDDKAHINSTIRFTESKPLPVPPEIRVDELMTVPKSGV